MEKEEEESHEGKLSGKKGKERINGTKNKGRKKGSLDG